MCTPETIAAIASETASLVSSIYQIESDKAVGKFNEQQSIKKAKIAEKNAAYERQKGIEDSREARLKAIQNMASVKAEMAGGNINTSSLTSINLIEDEKQDGEIDALKIIDASEKSSDSYLEKANDHYANAKLTSFKTKTNYVTGYLSLAKFGKSGVSIYENHKKKKDEK